MTWFTCKYCNYRFEADSEKSGKKCPWCGKGEIRREPDADELLLED